jgi:hypothetical protein
MDYVILDNMMSRDWGPATTVVHTQSAGTPQVLVPDTNGSTVVYQKDSHFWRSTIFLLLGFGALYGIYRLMRLAIDK